LPSQNLKIPTGGRRTGFQSDEDSTFQVGEKERGGKGGSFIVETGDKGPVWNSGVCREKRKE